MAADLVSKRRDGRNKPSLLIKGMDPTFLPALDALRHRRQGPQLRANKSLHQPLAKQVSRFTLAFETEEQNPAILGLLDWADNSVVRPLDFSESPSLVPAAVNMRFPKEFANPDSQHA
jgi:hypothetical protein